MNKEELIQIHALMVLVKDFLEKRGKGEFFKYNALQISPTHVHKHKYEHKNAIFILGEEILSAMVEDSSINVVDDSSINVVDDSSINVVDDSSINVVDDSSINASINEKLLC